MMCLAQAGHAMGQAGSYTSRKEDGAALHPLSTHGSGPGLCLAQTRKRLCQVDVMVTAPAVLQQALCLGCAAESAVLLFLKC